jgi:hypothetical protein
MLRYSKVERYSFVIVLFEKHGILFFTKTRERVFLKSIFLKSFSYNENINVHNLLNTQPSYLRRKRQIS